MNMTSREVEPESCNSESILISIEVRSGACGSAVGWGTILQAGISRVRVPMKWIFFRLT
jgi:hypothetical protein